MARKHFIYDVIYCNTKVKKSLRKLEKCKPEFYKECNNEVRKFLKEFERALGKWAILIIHNSDKLSINEEIIFEANCFKDSHGFIQTDYKEFVKADDFDERCDFLKSTNSLAANPHPYLFHLAFEKLAECQEELKKIRCAKGKVAIQ